MKNQFLPVSIKPENRLSYYEVLDNYAITGSLDGIANLIYELEEKRLDEINKIINQAINSNQEIQILIFAMAVKNVMNQVGNVLYQMMQKK